MLWALHKIGWWLEFPFEHWKNVFMYNRPGFREAGDYIFSWQMIFMVTGLVLLAGRRSSGIIFIGIGGLFLIPKLHISDSLLIPLLLIGIGVAMIAKFIK